MSVGISFCELKGVEDLHLCRRLEGPFRVPSLPGSGRKRPSSAEKKGIGTEVFFSEAE